LTKAGPRYQMHDPKTWPLQASFAYTGQWKKLNDWQDKHSGGRKKGKVTKKAKSTTKKSTTKAKSSGSSSAISATRKAEILGGAKNYYGRLKWDDHKVVEGIGPKIEGLLHGIGIKTWKQLSEAKYDTLKGMLTKAGPRYQMHDPKTWAKQAGMAYRGQWGKLKKWQDELDGGGKKSSGSSKKAKSSSRSAGYSSEQKSKMLTGARGYFGRIKWDDLKVVEGIGPKIEGLCHKIGIKTWQKLSETDAKVLKDMLTKAGPRYQMHDPKTWPKQAGMAAKGDWAKLKKWQDEHSGGRA